ncbi:PadR family transcriptional regulator [Clostridioides difficile]|uniref:PadR family transcriptional regulator n=1 Tax=Clostridioides difficile TaxID=1496 RepID=UPI00146139CE|nr:PadR family transcriptional regulator [Clostridioides difficile]
MDSRYIQQFKKGSLEMILLCLIAKRETYGYEIILELNNNGASVLGYAKEGTVYPILYRSQQAELIKCRIAPSTANGGSKKYYSLTGKGRETLEELLKFWDSYTECVNGFIKGYTHSEKAI